MGRAVYSRDSLLEWSLSINNNGRRCNYDARKWEVFEKILRMIVLNFFFGIKNDNDVYKEMNYESKLMDYTPNATTKA